MNPPENHHRKDLSSTTSLKDNKDAHAHMQHQNHDLIIPIVYQTLTANAQNELDRLYTVSEAARSRKNSLTNDDIVRERIGEALTHAYESTYHDITHRDNHDHNEEANARIRFKSARVHPSPNFNNDEKQLSSISFENTKNSNKITTKNKPEISFDDHLITLSNFLTRYDTSPIEGLRSDCISERRLKYGKNVLPREKKESRFVTYLKELFGGYNVIMWLVIVLSCLCWKPLGEPNPDQYNLILSCFITFCVVSQTTFLFIQQYRSDNLMASFQKLMPQMSYVLRDSKWIYINSWELVIGDVIRLNAGDKVPADIRVFECNHASVETSSLTGETEPVKLSTTKVDTNPYETRNIALFGSLLLEGTITGIVFQVGEQTVMSKIADLTQKTKKELSTMEREINYFGLVIGCMSVGTALLTFILWYVAVRPTHPQFLTYSQIVISSISVIISFFPQGLPISVTLTLSLVAKNMKKVNVLVKKLSVIETLGSATVIASDKTGTITTNKMTLIKLSTYGLDEQNFLKTSYANEATTNISEFYKLVMKFACLCNKATIDHSAEHEKNTIMPNNSIKTRDVNVLGSPTECGILKCLVSHIDIETVRLQNKLVYEIPFNSRYKYNLTVHRIDKENLVKQGLNGIENLLKANTHLVLMKGAPEVIVEFCAFGINGENVQLFDYYLKSKYMENAQRFAASGERVLGIAFAFTTIDDEKNCDLLFDETNLPVNLCYASLLSLIDPPRPGVAEAVNDCHDGGIKVMMVTGDHPLTAVAIASMVNIIRSGNDVKDFDKVQNNLLKIKENNSQESDLKERKKWFSIKNIYFIEKLKQKLLPKQALIIAKKYPVNGAVMIQGKDISHMNVEHWDYVLSHNEIVFARTTPQNKLAIVKQLQRRGEIVTVTGDGVNDAPALKKADIGIAMGISGTETSKEAAQLIIIDDNFATIVNGIRQGRLLFDNLKKIIGYQLPAGCFSEIIPVLAAVFLGLPLPLTTLQMMAICLCTDIIGSVGMVYEYAESDLMKRKPRNAAYDHLISFLSILKIYCQTGIIQCTIAFFMYFYTLSQFNINIGELFLSYEKWTDEGPFAGSTDKSSRLIALNHAQTAYFVALVTTQVINLFTVRTRFQSFFRQKFRWPLIIFCAAQMSVVIILCYTSPLYPYLQTTRAEWYHFVYPFLMGFAVFIVDEIKKLLIRTYPKSWIANFSW